MVFPSNITTCFKVLVRCFTYNQSQYIEDALNGFAMQQTNFPFVCLVMDDCSTDGEQEVIKAYLDRECDMSKAEFFEDDTTTMTLVPHRTNVNCTFAAYLLKKNLYKVKGAKMVYATPWREHCEYEALCEGDDYWTDPYKLQKQVDFLNSHEDFSMCFHAAQLLAEGVDTSKKNARFEALEEREYYSAELFTSWTVPTASIVYRINMVNAFRIKHTDWIMRGDIILVLRCSHSGRVWGMSKQMSVYRVQPNGISNDPLYLENECAKMPNHYKCILINYPQVDKAPIHWCISRSYYARMKHGKGFLNKVRDFFLFIVWDPSGAAKKMLALLRKTRWRN